MRDSETEGADVIEQADVAPDAVNEAPAPEPTVSELAAEMGWSPKDQWRGDAAKWKPAADFLKTTVDINRTLSKDVKAMRAETERLARTSASIVEQQVTERVAAAEARFQAAVEAGDAREARAATRDIDALQAQRADAAGNPEASFAEANPWYGKDEEATAFAVATSQRLAAQGKSVADQLEAAQAGVRKRFPELFPDAPPPAKVPPAVHGTTSRTAAPSNRVKGASDLPLSAKTAGEMMVRKGLVKDIATYAKFWHEENA